LIVYNRRFGLSSKWNQRLTVSSNAAGMLFGRRPRQIRDERHHVRHAGSSRVATRKDASAMTANAVPCRLVEIRIGIAGVLGTC
jgi:hypothetical protein